VKWCASTNWNPANPPYLFLRLRSHGHCREERCPPMSRLRHWPWGAYLGDEGMQKGIRIKTSSFTRHHVNVNMCRAKSVTTYANSILAHQEVANDNYDEALLAGCGRLCCRRRGVKTFSSSRKGKLYTPDLTSCLEGITRDSIITLAKEWASK